MVKGVARCTLAFRAEGEGRGEVSELGGCFWRMGMVWTWKDGGEGGGCSFFLKGIDRLFDLSGSTGLR